MRTQKLTHKLHKFRMLTKLMGESQSRYSIVERLTQRKLEIMNSKANIKEDVKKKEQKIDKIKKDLENWKEDIQEDIKREERKRILEVEKTKQEFENAKEQMESKEKVLNEQIKAIEEALTSIEEISKTAPNIQS